MKQTDELCKRLDELGVKYDATSYDNVVFWGDAEYGLYGDGHTLLIVNGATPAQAIAATVGSEPDDATMLKLHDEMNAALLEFERAMGIEKASGAIVVPFVARMHELLEKAATVGVGTCHINVLDNLSDTNGMGDVWLECDACHWQMPLEPSTPRFKFCPNCGKRIIEEVTE